MRHDCVKLLKLKMSHKNISSQPLRIKIIRLTPGSTAGFRYIFLFNLPGQLRFEINANSLQTTLWWKTFSIYNACRFSYKKVTRYPFQGFHSKKIYQSILYHNFSLYSYQAYLHGSKKQRIFWSAIANPVVYFFCRNNDWTDLLSI